MSAAEVRIIRVVRPWLFIAGGKGHTPRAVCVMCGDHNVGYRSQRAKGKLDRKRVARFLRAHRRCGFL